MSMMEMKKELETELERMRSGRRNVSAQDGHAPTDNVKALALWKGREEGIQRALGILQEVWQRESNRKMGLPK